MDTDLIILCLKQFQQTFHEFLWNQLLVLPRPLPLLFMWYILARLTLWSVLWLCRDIWSHSFCVGTAPKPMWARLARGAPRRVPTPLMLNVWIGFSSRIWSRQIFDAPHFHFPVIIFLVKCSGFNLVKLRNRNSLTDLKQLLLYSQITNVHLYFWNFCRSSLHVAVFCHWLYNSNISGVTLHKPLLFY